jgi:hypothetical protein
MRDALPISAQELTRIRRRISARIAKLIKPSLSRPPIGERRYAEGDLAANLAAELRYTPLTNSG